MLRIALLTLIFLISLTTSSSIVGKLLSRRQIDPEDCHAIEDFDCKCSYYRVTCTTDRELPSPINILQNEKYKYSSVELAITGAHNIHVDDHTFEPVKDLHKPDANDLEFRIKFERFTELHLTSPGIFNRVFSTNISSNTRTHLALEIYNPDVRPNDNIHLFQNLNVDSLELSQLYPSGGTFQQLFDGANIKYLRVSGGDIRLDLSRPFTGTIGRLEIAKQASELSIQNFPLYPVHELIINAFYVTEFHSEHPPNYDNLRELRFHSPARIPANAFHQYPNIHTLSISTDEDIDPQALNGLINLDKLIIKDSKPSIDLLNNVPNVKEFETNIDKLDEKTQCQFIEKLANGQVAIRAIPNADECTCVSSYLDSAIGHLLCGATYCENSSCAVIRNNYDVLTRTFKTPPPILRSDGTNALQLHEQRVYSTPFQVTQRDQEKFYRATFRQYDSGGSNEDVQSSSLPDQPYNSSGTHPSWFISSDGHNSVNTHDDQKLDLTHSTSTVENENTTPVEKSPWYDLDDHDSYQTDPVQPDWNSVTNTTTTISHYNWNAIRELFTDTYKFIHELFT